MSKHSDRNTVQPSAPEDEQERIRRQKIDELDRLCDRVGAEARRRGLTEEILKELLNEKSTNKKKAQTGSELDRSRKVNSSCMKKLFTERHGMNELRVKEELDVDLTRGLLTVINAKIDENLFGEAFSEECPGGGNRSIGCDLEKLKAGLAAYKVIWPRGWPDETGNWPGDPQLFDLIEFLYEHAGLPKAYGFHSFFGHSHLSYDQAEGRAKFEQDVNRFFERNGLAFELRDGEVTRMVPSGLQEALASAVFATGDADLDRLLETAREKFLNRSLEVRKEGLEKLWDAWERLKTIEPGRDKSSQATAILDKAAAEPFLRERLECEARELNFIGNNLMIRHTEVGKTPIVESAQVDYLFHRMFAMVRLLLRSSGRGG